MVCALYCKYVRCIANAGLDSYSCNVADLKKDANSDVPQSAYF